jgi:2-polyprenyl-3-methyl-5-hydroxy-6-metoxy-1,4-benzoquinol methylase
MRKSLVDRGSVERLLLLVGAVQSGLVDALAERAALSASDAARSAGTDPRASGIVLEALASIEVVERVPAAGRGLRADDPEGSQAGPLYRLSPLGRAHLVDEGPDLERSGLLHQVNKLRGWLELPEVIRTGEPSARGMARQDVRSRALAMGERDPEVLDEIVERCFAYAGGITTMLDVGGAVGHLARQFARRRVKATLFDREDVIPVAREFLGESAVGIEMAAGDYTAALPAGPFDLVYFGNVYHIYGPVTNERVTREALNLITPGGLIAIQDYVWGRSLGAEMLAVNMLQSTTEGGVWTEAEYRAWLGGAGFVNIDVLDLKNSGAQLIIGQRPGR